MKSRIVITGLGTVNAIGENVEEYWSSILNGKYGIQEVEFENIQRKYQIGKVNKEYFHNSQIGQQLNSTDIDSCSMFLILAIQEAITCSELAPDDYSNAKYIIGTALGEIATIEEKIMSESDDKIEEYLLNDAIENVRKYFKLNKNPVAVSSTCTSSMNAIGMGYKSILSGKEERVIVGGSEAISLFILNGLRSTRGLTVDRMKPFDLKRNGMLLGEGAGAIVLESYESAKKRNAKIYAEITGYQTVSEAYHLMVPELSGERIAQSLVYDTSEPEKLFVLVSANGTKYNDQALYEGLNKKYDQDLPYIADIKPLLGHTLGGSGVIEGIAAIKSLQEQCILPIYGMDNPEYKIKYSTKIIPHEVENIIHISTSFGGNVASICYKKVEE